jgi:LysM repeat protein
MSDKHDFHSEITRSLRVGVEDGTAYQAIIWFKDKDDNNLALYESDDYYIENKRIDYTFNVATLAKQLSVKEEDLSYLNLGIKIAHDDPKVEKGEIIRANIKPSDKITQLYLAPLPPKEYTVKKGDTLSEIVDEFGLSGYMELADVNDINPPYTIYPKEVLKIPSPLKPLPQERKLHANRLIMGSEVAVVVKGTPYANAHVEIKLNKQRLLDFDVTLNYRGEAQKRVKLRPTDDNEYKALIKSFAPQVGAGIREEKLTLHAQTEGKNYKNRFDTDDMNTLSLNCYQTYIKSAQIIDPLTKMVVANLNVTKQGNNIIFSDENAEPQAQAKLDDIVNALANINNGVGGLAAGLEYADGTFALSNSKGFNLKHYPSSWQGNGYVKTYGMAKWGKLLGDGSNIISVVIGVVQIDSAMDKDEAYLDENNISKPDYLPNVGEQTEQQVGSTLAGFGGGSLVTLGILALPAEAPVLVILGSAILIGGAVGWALSWAGSEAVDEIQDLKGSTLINDYPLDGGN